MLSFNYASVNRLQFDTTNQWFNTGKVGIGTTAPVAKLHIGSDVEPNISNQTLFVQGSKTGYAGFAGLPMGGLMVYDDTASTAGSGGAISFGANTGSSQRTWIAAIESRRDSAVNDGTNYGGSLVFYTRPAQATPEERMRINSSGNVGIGTTSPSAKLEIAGFSTGAGLKLNYGNSSGTIEVVNFIANGAANGVIGMQMVSAGVGDLWLGGSGGRILTLYRDGNVGIGTSSPAYKLDVLGDAKIGNSSGAGNLWIIGARDWRWIAGTTGYGVGSGFGLFDNTAGAYRIAFDTNGNLGVGTTSPTSQLHVVGNVQLYGTSGGNININTAASGNGDISFNGSTFTMVSNSSSASLVLSTNSTERLRITSAGNVGIGTTSPSQLLELSGTSAALRIISTSGDAYIRLTDNGVRNWDLKVVDVSDYFQIGGTSATSLIVTGAGNVGVGTTSPADKLEVNGTTRTKKLRSNGIYYVGITGAKSSNASAFDMFDISNTSGNQTIEIVLSHHHSGGGQHGSFRRTILALNGYTDFIVLEDTSTNFGGGLGFTITRTSLTTMRIGWAGATSYAGSYSFIGWIKGNGDYSVTNVGMDSFDAA